MVKTFYNCDLEAYDTENDYVTSVIAKYGCWEPIVTNIMLNILGKEKGICIDLGVYIGYYTFLMGLYNQTYGIEADPVTFQKLNISMDRFVRKENINLMNLAVSSSDGLKLNFEHYGHSNTGASKVTQKSTDIVVDSITFDKFVQQNKIDDILIVKIDVEGHELDAINGMRKSLSNRMIKYIFLELSPIFVGVDESVTIVNLIAENGYEFYDMGIVESGKLEDHSKYNYESNKIYDIKKFLIENNVKQRDILFVRK